MALDFNKAESINGGKPTAPKPQPKAPKGGAIAKAPALAQLEAQITAQGDQLEAQARAMVQACVADTRNRVRLAVAEELEICGDDDFFGFSSLFTDPQLEGDAIGVLTIAAEQSV
jgi:hypothetical protein